MLTKPCSLTKPLGLKPFTTDFIQIPIAPPIPVSDIKMEYASKIGF